MGVVMYTISPVKVTFEHILVPTDFSDVSLHALEYAKALAGHQKSELLLVHVNRLPDAVIPPEAAWIDELELLQQEQKQLEQSTEALRSEGFRARAIWLTGELQDEILSVVRRRKVDLIVVGTHGDRGLERFLAGSDAEVVLRHALCPVVTLGPAVRDSRHVAWPPREVLCATDLDPRSAGIAAFAYLLARQHDAKFVLFHADSPGHKQNVSWTAFDQAFRKYAHVPEGLEAHLSFRTWQGNEAPGTRIVDLAKERGSDLIVMGARAVSSIATHLTRGTAPKVAAEAPCPVMTLHQP
jgi:nucleotide-binding universal stress UspA family protein